jgi:hypothetical protein
VVPHHFFELFRKKTSFEAVTRAAVTVSLEMARRRANWDIFVVGCEVEG